MGIFGHDNCALGLDCGEESIKAVVLERHGRQCRIRRVFMISRKQEGLLDNADLSAALLEVSNGAPELRRMPAACGIDTRQVNAIISPFPPVHGQSRLAKMVEYQIAALCGLSGESFCHDFQPLAPLAGGMETPVLLAVCKSALAESKLGFCVSAQLNCEEITSNGLALMNAFAFLRPREASSPGQLHGVIDLGAKSTIFGVYGNGRIHFLTAWSNDGGSGSRSEQILAAISRWRESQPGEDGALELARLWLSGGGAMSEELQQEIGERTGIPAGILGVPAGEATAAAAIPERGGLCPALAIAYGLALQALGLGAIRISLLPEVVSWQLRRRRNFPYLAATALLFFGVMIAGMVLYTLQMKQAIQELAIQERQLDECLALYPKIEQAYGQITAQQNLLIPIAESGFRAQRFMETIDSCQKAIGNGAADDTTPNRRGWCIYLADEFSFRRDSQPREDAPREDAARGARADGGADGNAVFSTRSASPLTASPPSAASLSVPAAREAAANSAAVRDGAAADAATPEPASIPASQLPPSTPVSKVPRLRAMYLGGLLPVEDSARYIPLKELQERLNASEAFTGVDDYADYLTGSFQKRYAAPWDDFLERHRQQLGVKYTPFFLQLPFRSTLIDD